MTGREDGYIDAILNRDEVVAVGASKYGKVRLTPGAGDYFSNLFMPKRSWRVEKQNHVVVDQSYGPQDEEEAREMIKGWLADDEIEVEVKER